MILLSYPSTVDPLLYNRLTIIIVMVNQQHTKKKFRPTQTYEHTVCVPEVDEQSR